MRVLLQRAFSARESRFFPSSSFLRTAKKLVYRAKNLVNILEYLVIPKSNHAVALRNKKRSADFVLFRALDMLGAIELDDEAPFGRAEVGEVRSNRELTAKPGVALLTASQMAPQNSFRFCLLEPQPSCVLLGRFDRAHHWNCLPSDVEKQGRRKEQNPDPRAEGSALYKDPHLHPLPDRERRQTGRKKQNPDPRAEGSALYQDPHLHSLPNRERRQKSAPTLIYNRLIK